LSHCETDKTDVQDQNKRNTKKSHFKLSQKLIVQLQFKFQSTAPPEPKVGWILQL